MGVLLGAGLFPVGGQKADENATARLLRPMIRARIRQHRRDLATGSGGLHVRYRFHDRVYLAIRAIANRVKIFFARKRKHEQDR